VSRVHWLEVQVGPGQFADCCPICGCIVVRDLMERHEQWHFGEPPKPDPT
jgi:hypothetical protein